MQRGFQSITQTNKKGVRAFTDFIVKPQTNNRVQRSLNRYHKVFAEAFYFEANNKLGEFFTQLVVSYIKLGEFFHNFIKLLSHRHNRMKTRFLAFQNLCSILFSSLS